MNVTAAQQTLQNLAHCPLLLDNDRGTLVFYRAKQGTFPFLSVAKQHELSLMQRIRRALGSRDFAYHTLNELVDSSLTTLAHTKPKLTPQELTTAKRWCRYIKRHALHLSPVEVEEKTEKLFLALFEKKHPSSLEAVQSEEEAALLSPCDPMRVRGIVSQNNWCFVNSFIHAAYAADGFKRMLGKRLAKFDVNFITLEEDIQKLEAEKKQFLTSFSLEEEALKTLADTALPLHENLAQGLPLERRKALELQLSSIFLPQGLSIEHIQTAQSLFQKLQYKKVVAEDMPKAKIRIEMFLRLLEGMKLPSDKDSALLDNSLLEMFVDSFKKTNSPFFRNLQSHTQEDPTELLRALSVDDLAVEKKTTWEEVSCKKTEEHTPTSAFFSRPPFDALFIKAVDKPRVFSGSVIVIDPPELLSQSLSLGDFFIGVQDSYPLEKEKQNIIEAAENKSLFDGEEGLARKEDFLLNAPGTVPVVRKLSLLSKPPRSLPIMISRFGPQLTKRNFALSIPFRLEVPSNNTGTKAVYLLRSAIVHQGVTLRCGHFYTISADLTSISSITHLPSRFVVHDGSFIRGIEPEDAMRRVQVGGSFLFYDLATCFKKKIS